MMDYKIIQLEDISSAAKRIKVAVAVNLSRENKEEIDEFAINVIKEMRQKKVENERTLMRHGDKPFEVVYLYLYNNMDQKNYGLPLARASFIDPKCRVKPRHFSEVYIDENTTIRYDGMFEELNKSIEENKVSNDLFISKFNDQFIKLTQIYNDIKKDVANLDAFIEKYYGYKDELIAIRDEFIGYPNAELADLSNYHQGLIGSLCAIGVHIDSIKFSVEEKKRVILHELELASEDIEKIRSELQNK